MEDDDNDCEAESPYAASLKKSTPKSDKSVRNSEIYKFLQKDAAERKKEFEELKKTARAAVPWGKGLEGANGSCLRNTSFYYTISSI